MAAAVDPATGPAAENPVAIRAPLAATKVAAADTPDQRTVPPKMSIFILIIKISFLIEVFQSPKTQNFGCL